MRRRAVGILLYCLLMSLIFDSISVRAAGKGNSTGRILFISSYDYGWNGTRCQMEGMQEKIGDEALID